MPPLATHDIPHTALTDHRILRDPKAAPTDGDAVNDALAIFTENEGALPADELRRARGLLLASQAASGNDPDMAKQALDLLGAGDSAPGGSLLAQEADPAALAKIGIAQVLAGNHDEALSAWDRALRAEPNHETSLHSLALYFLSAGDVERGLATALRLAQADPTNSEFRWLSALFLDRAGRREEALAAAEKSVELDPTALHVRQWLATAYQRAGEPQKALEQKDLLQRLQGR
jgi:tetratricopeptide (TPR) repeat protein